MDLGYGPQDLQQGIAYMKNADPAGILADLDATIQAAARVGNVGMVGYCWGGRVTYLAACRTNVTAAVAYYGGGIGQLLPETPRCPMLLHYAERDAHIPPAEVEAVRKASPQSTVHLYPADHGFNCPDRASYDSASAHLAYTRTLEFLRRHIG